MSTKEVNGWGSIPVGQVLPDYRIHIRQVILEQFQLGESICVSDEVLRLSISCDELLAASVINIKLRLLAHKMHEDRFTTQVPLTWWDHLKSRLGWKHSTREIVTSQTQWLVCPHLPPPKNAEQIHIQYLGGRGE